MIVGEPTSNVPLVGHKVVLWLQATTAGKTAHGSMPEKGENAIYKAAKAIALLENFDFQTSHPLMGQPTLNIGTMSGGENINSVPDHAQFTLDIRTLPNQKNGEVFNALKAYLGNDVELQKTDEYCLISNIEEAMEAYIKIGER
jgi:succinyl-diaminopimelate desuccinylase